MESSANTFQYFIAGYAVIFGIMAAYVISLVVRWNNLKQEAALLEELEKDDPPK